MFKFPQRVFLGFVIPAAAVALQYPACQTTPRAATCRNICAFTNPNVGVLSGHIATSMLRYEPSLNGSATSPLKWNINYFPTSANKSSPVVSARGVVQAWKNGRGEELCDVVIGSGLSAVDLALLGNINMPWIEPSLSLPILTNRVEFPTMLNALPSLTNTAERFVHAFRDVESWCLLNDETATSRAWRSVIETHIHTDKHQLDVEREVLSTPHVGDIDHAISDILGSKTRYVFVLISVFFDRSEEVLQALAARKVHESKIILFMDEACGAFNLSIVPGAMCVSYEQTSSNLTRLTLPAGHQFVGYDAFAKQHFPTVVAAHQALGAPAPLFLLPSSTYFTGMVHDAVHHYMLVAHRDPSAAPTRESLLTNVSDGAMGTLSFAADGVRTTATIDMMNVRRNGSLVLAARSEENDGDHWSMVSDSFYAMGSDFTLTTLPSTYEQVPESSSKTTLIIGVAAGGTAFIALVVVASFFVRAAFAPDPRNNNAAPKDDSKPFAVAFTDIQSSTALWATAPQAMSEAVEQHHTIIRSLISTYKGYEVKTIGDSFMVAFVSSASAVTFAQELQKAFYDAEWAPELDRVYQCHAAEAGLSERATDPSLWNGLRVRVGVHYGVGRIVLDPVTKGYDYYGTVTNAAARVETVGNGGQVIVTDKALEAAEVESSGVTSQSIITDLGEETLRGLNDAMQLFQLVPKEFEAREFPPLRVDRLEDEDFENLVEVVSDTAAFDVVDGDAESHHAPPTRSKSVFASEENSTHGRHSHSTYIADDPYLAYLRVLLSPLQESDRGTVLSMLVMKWHVNATSSAKSLARNATVRDKAMQGVAYRSGKAHQCLHTQSAEHSTTESPGGHNPNGPLGRPRAPSRSRSSVAGASSSLLPNPFVDGDGHSHGHGSHMSPRTNGMTSMTQSTRTRMSSLRSATSVPS